MGAGVAPGVGPLAGAAEEVLRAGIAPGKALPANAAEEVMGAGAGMPLAPGHGARADPHR